MSRYVFVKLLLLSALTNAILASPQTTTNSTLSDASASASSINSGSDSGGEQAAAANVAGYVSSEPQPCATCVQQPPPPPCTTCVQEQTTVYQPPPQTYQPPSQIYQPPEETYQPPAGEYQPPPKTIHPPLITFQPPAQSYQPPLQRWQPPSITWQPPPQTFTPPEQTFQPPLFVYQPPVQRFVPQSQTYQPPLQTFQPPPHTYRPPPVKISIPLQTIFFPPQAIQITTRSLPPAPPSCQTCPCYWCYGHFGGWQRPSANTVAAASSQVGWSSVSNGECQLCQGRQYFDVSEARINSSKTACDVFIERHADGPVEADKLVSYVNQTFYGDAAKRVKYAKGVEASTFHCCHSEFEREYFPRKKQAYVQPLLPKGETCSKLVAKLFQDLSGKSNNVKVKDNNVVKTPVAKKASITAA